MNYPINWELQKNEPGGSFFHIVLIFDCGFSGVYFINNLRVEFKPAVIGHKTVLFLLHVI